MKQETGASNGSWKPVPSTPLEYDIWIGKDCWTLSEASKLICGRNPMDRIPSPSRYNRKFKLIDIVDMAFADVQAGNLKAVRFSLIPTQVLVEPERFLKWAESQKFEVPPELAALPEHERDHQGTVQNQNRAVVLAVVKTLLYMNPSLDHHQLSSHPALSHVLGANLPPPDTVKSWLEETLGKASS